MSARPLDGDEATEVLSALDAVLAHIALTDGEGVIVWVNAIWRRFAAANLFADPMCGVGQNYFHVCEAAGSERSASQMAAGLREVLRGERAEFSLEYPCDAPSEKRWFRLSVSPRGGGQPGVVIMHVDISALKNAEARMRASEARLLEAQQIAHFGSWETHLPDLRVEWSAETHRIFGTDPRTFHPTHPLFLERVHPNDRAVVDQAFVASLTGGPCFIEHRVVTPEGAVKQVEEHWRVEHDVRGVPTRVYGTCQDVTERHRALSALHQSQVLLRIAGRAARLGGWMIELPERVLTWSDEVSAIHEMPAGHRPTLAEGMAYFVPEHREEIARLMRACEEEGLPYDVELNKLTATGRRIWARAIGEAVRDADGKIVRIQGALQDITARKAAEGELARIHRALEMLSSCNEALVRASDEQSLLEQVCRIAVGVGGYRMGWVGYAGDETQPTISPRAVAGVEDGYLTEVRSNWSDDPGPAATTIRTGTITICADLASDPTFGPKNAAALRGYRSVICLPLRDGDDTFGLLSLYAGELNHAAADERVLLQQLCDNLAFGITSLRARLGRRRATEQLAQQAALLDQATDAIFVRDLEHRITYWNRGAERLYGWSSAEVLGRRVNELLHRRDEDPAVFRAATSRLLAEGEWSGEVHKVNKSGQPLTVEARWTLLRDEQGQPRAVLTINTDVTEKRRLETQFFRAQRLESIGTLAGGIAHDLNNLLSPIMMSVDVLKESVTTDDDREVLGTLERSTQRAAALVKQVLTFARGVEGRRAPIDCRTVLQDIAAIIRDTFPKNIVCKLRPCPQPWQVIGDATQLHQVLMNLCVNARDAMPLGGELTLGMENVVLDADAVRLNPEATAGRFLQLTVADTGSGISPEVQDRMFEPFFTTKALGKGTGLGLSTTLAIIKSHSGLIILSSELGRGTQFKVCLPADPGESAPGPGVAPPSRLPLGQGELVLVVDDEHNIRETAKRALERFGYRVLLAGNGAQALQIFAQRRADIAVVLTDMAMPVMDGASMIAELRAIDPKVRIIGSSGNSSAGELGHFLAKPYATEELLQALRAVLGR